MINNDSTVIAEDDNNTFDSIKKCIDENSIYLKSFIKDIYIKAYQEGFEEGYKTAQVIEFNSTRDKSKFFHKKFNFSAGDELINDLGEKLLVLKENSDGSLKCVNIYNKLSSLVEGSVTIIYHDDLHNWKPTGKKFNTNINEI